MNILNNLTGFTAALVALSAAVMWGSWFISLKHLGKYPIEGFYVVMFSISLVFVWCVSLIAEGKEIFTNMAEIAREHPSKIAITLIGGMLYASGMWVSLKIMDKVGLALSQPLLQSVTLIAGTAVSISIGGRPASLTNTKVALTVIFLLGAAFLVYFADKFRNQAAEKSDDGKKFAGIKSVIGLTLISAVLTVSYDVAISYSLETVTQPVGLQVFPFMCLLSTGAFVGVMVTCGVSLTKNHQWKEIPKAPWKIHKWSLISAVCHYGGNIIHSFATRGLSTAVSYPLGLTSGLWTQLWGLKYGEFKGAPVSAYVCQFASFACYILAACCVTF